jgi:DNA-3-methyladenine glycosylase II
MVKNYRTQLNHLKRTDPRIYKIAKDINYATWFTPWERMQHTTDYFKALCGIIVGQQLSTKVADTIFKRFVNSFDGEVLPQTVLDTQHEKLREIGLSNAKVKYVKDLAEKVNSKMLLLEKLPNLSDEEVISELTKVKGIGTWSAEMFLIFNLSRENVFSHKDLGLLRGIEKNYDLKLPTVEQVECIISKWHPYKSYGSIALWHSLNNKS